MPERKTPATPSAERYILYYPDSVGITAHVVYEPVNTKNSEGKTVKAIVAVFSGRLKDKTFGEGWAYKLVKDEDLTASRDWAAVPESLQHHVERLRTLRKDFEYDGETHEEGTEDEVGFLNRKGLQWLEQDAAWKDQTVTDDDMEENKLQAMSSGFDKSFRSALSKKRVWTVVWGR